MKVYTRDGSLILVTEDRGYIRTTVHNYRDDTTSTSTVSKSSPDGVHLLSELQQCRDVTAVVRALTDLR